jgi:hypothetical protein
MTNGGSKSQKAQSVLSLHIARLILIICVSCSVSGSSRGQQPFITDDADVTQRRKFQLHIANEFDILQRSQYPLLRQNYSAFELDYGLLDGVEVGFIVPLLVISNSHIVTPKTLFGFSDSTLHVKYNFYKEHAKSRLPAMTISAIVQFPTGNAESQLGSGLMDYYLNGIFQKSYRSRTKLRVNGGILFSGDAQTGVLGIRTKGRVFTGGASVVRKFTKRLDLGVEITGAVARNATSGRKRLQSLIGGNYALTEKMTFDFGVVGGHSAASPRLGLFLGISLDF